MTYEEAKPKIDEAVAAFAAELPTDYSYCTSEPEDGRGQFWLIAYQTGFENDEDAPMVVFKLDIDAKKKTGEVCRDFEKNLSAFVFDLNDFLARAEEASDPAALLKKISEEKETPAQEVESGLARTRRKLALVLLGLSVMIILYAIAIVVRQLIEEFF